VSFAQTIGELRTNLSGLGPRRVAILAVLAAAVFVTVSAGSYFISRPSMIVLYSGLEPEDVNAVGAALRQSGYAFDISPDGKSVLSNAATASQARMMLAERGLPQSSTSGYELFDNMGSLGLTSFMQDVTMVRALEGELVRTIQSMRGVKSARVHLVMAERSSFRRQASAPSASVVIQQIDGAGAERASAIRYLVAAAVPGMSLGQVTVLDWHGKLLASGDDSTTAAPTRLMELERNLSQDLTDRLTRTLGPHLGLGNFSVSVVAQLNIDKRQVQEKTFDPEVRVERSVRNIREKSESEDSQRNTAATVATEIPEPPLDATGQTARQQSEKRDETSNFEINSRTVQSESDGYKIDRLSVAVLVNQEVLEGILGQGVTPQQVATHLEDMQSLLSSVVGLSTDRGDTIAVRAVKFAEAAEANSQLDSSGVLHFLDRYAGTLIQSGVALLCVILLVFLGIKPAVRVLSGPAQIAGQVPAGGVADVAQIDSRTGIEPRLVDDRTDPAGATGRVGAANAGGLPDVLRLAGAKPEEKLEQLVAYDEEQAAIILKHWLREASPS
jgi:flagellar M-ring protein FliF